jgi:hypothetical protein
MGGGATGEPKEARLAGTGQEGGGNAGNEEVPKTELPPKEGAPLPPKDGTVLLPPPKDESALLGLPTNKGPLAVELAPPRLKMDGEATEAGDELNRPEVEAATGVGAELLEAPGTRATAAEAGWDGNGGSGRKGTLRRSTSSLRDWRRVGRSGVDGLLRSCTAIAS